MTNPDDPKIAEMELLGAIAPVLPDKTERTHVSSPKTSVKSPVSIYIVHHPECKEAEVLSGKLYDWFRLGYLSGDSSGAGLPVYFRREVKEIRSLGNRSSGKSDSIWRIKPSIDYSGAALNVIIVLVDHRMVVEEKWRGAIVALSEEVSRVKELRRDEIGEDESRSQTKRSRVELLPAALHDSFYRTGPLSSNFNSVRLAGLSLENQEAALRRAATEMTGRLMRAASGSGFKQLDIFLSHAKQDGLEIAATLRDGIQRFGQLEPWFDANDLAWGQKWQEGIKVATTDTAAMVAIVTDAYPSRPWCRTEARNGRKPRKLKGTDNVWCMQPMVAVHSPGSTWTRAMPMLEGVPRIGWHPSQSVDPTEYIVDRLVLETMLAQVHREVAKDLDAADRGNLNVCFITWVPDSWSLSKLRAVIDKKCGQDRPSAAINTIVYPGYGLTPSEIQDLEPAIHSFSRSTQLVSYEDYWLTCDKHDFPNIDPASRLLVALSSDGSSVELADVGLGVEHCDELMVRLAMRLLHQNQRLAFGGTLTERRPELDELMSADAQSEPGASTLAEHLISAATNWQSEGAIDDEGRAKRGRQSDVTKPDTWPLLNYSAWPNYRHLDPEWKANLVGVCHFRHVRPADFSEAEVGRFTTDLHDPLTRRRHADALTEMRRASAKECDLRVVWGGEIKKSPGWMPGILEEVYETLTYRDAANPAFRKPLLILGGFGGCASKLAEYLLCRTASWPPDQLVPTSDRERDGLLTELERDSQRSVFEDCQTALEEFRELLWNKQTIVKKTAPSKSVLRRLGKIDDPNPQSSKLHGIEANTIWLALEETRPRDVTWLVMKAVKDVIDSMPPKESSTAASKRNDSKKRPNGGRPRQPR